MDLGPVLAEVVAEVERLLAEGGEGRVEVRVNRSARKPCVVRTFVPKSHGDSQNPPKGLDYAQANTGTRLREGGDVPREDAARS